MIRRRTAPDGLPFRVYERFGVRVYSIGYKLKSGRWAFRYECPVVDAVQIQKLRRQAIQESATVIDEEPVIGGFAGLIDAWFEWQEELPDTSEDKRADSTIAENKREAENLKKAWGHLEPEQITRTMGYEYLDACVKAKRPGKGNKEMSLAHLILEFGIRRGKLKENPLTGLRRNKTKKTKRLVLQHEMDLAVYCGRVHGGARHICAMGLKTAWLCVKRSVEVRAVQLQGIRPDGLAWRDGKDESKPLVVIEWSDELRATVEEARAIKRFHVAGSMYLFGNMRGQRYTKGGWKSILDDLMTECERVAAVRRDPQFGPPYLVEFRKFSLQDCRPKGVTDKLERGDDDVLNATNHTSEKMVRNTYDRRPEKRAKPAA